MSQSSLNPRASALSSHALSILGPLLRRVALVHRDRQDATGFAKAQASSADDDLCLEPNASASFATPLQLRLNQPYAAVPAALDMPPEQIAQAIAADRDPWAEEAGTYKTALLFHPPLCQLMLAARFGAMLDTPSTVNKITADRAFTFVTVPSVEDQKMIWAEIKDVIRWLGQLAGQQSDRWNNFATPVSVDDAGGDRFQTRLRETEFHKAVSAASREGRKTLAFARAQSAMPPVGHAMCERALTFPSFNADMCIEILRVTHSGTGEVAVDTLLDLLPPDAALASLPLAVVEAAFREPTSLKVAQTLSTAVLRLSKSTGKTLDDIVLNDSVMVPVGRLVSDVAAWRSGTLKWDDVSSSILLKGPPGNGKTLLAEAIAGSIGGTFVATSYSDCQRHGHQGDMLKALSLKVDEAIQAAPSVFFMDELDGFTHRASATHSSGYILGVVNGLLEHLSKLNQTPGVIVIGATNYPELVDPAVIRPGRFDLHLEMGNPDRAAIIRILQHALLKEDQTFDAGKIADQLLGSSGAQVTALVREARGVARAERTPLAQGHLAAVANRIMPPPEPDVMWRMAIHEAGHIVVSHVLGLPKPMSAAITNTGGFVDVPATLLESRESAHNRIAALLGGRAAEEVILGESLNGAGIGLQSDLAMATRLAAKIHFEWGFADQLAYTPYDMALPNRMDAEVVEKVDNILHQALDRSTHVIKSNRTIAIQIANTLMQNRELSSQAISDLLNTGSRP